MKTLCTIKKFLYLQLTIVFCMTGWNATSQTTNQKLTVSLSYSDTMPEFTLLTSCSVSNSSGFHDGNAWVDIDNDGDLDLIITNSNNNNKPNLMFRNERSDLFRQITNTEYTLQNLKFGLPGPYGDLDNDGDEDLVLVDWQGTKSRIYLNDGYGNYSLSSTMDKPEGAMSVLLDIDKDSYLDLVETGSKGGRIYTNDGAGSFTDFDQIAISPPHSNSSLACMSYGDADDDGDFDLYMGLAWSTNSMQDEYNMLYLNDGAENFIKEPDTSILVSTMGPTMGSSWVDFDNDGDMDLYVLESTIYGSASDQTGVLYVNKGGMLFEKQVIEPLEYSNSHRVSPVWGDLNNDGDLDLLVTIEKNEFYGHASEIKHNILFQNNGDGSFTEIKEGSLIEGSTHSATMEDYDNDGDLDVLQVGYAWSSAGHSFLYENQGNENTWLVLSCEGRISNHSAFGTRVNVIANINGERIIQTREITPTSGHNTSYPSNRLHFGLADTDIIDSLIIRWPMGNVDIHTQVKASQFYQAIEDSALKIDFKASNYIRQSIILEDTLINKGESLSFNLEDRYEFVEGDTVPEGDKSFSFSLYANENTEAVNADLESNTLTLTPGTTPGVSFILVKVSNGFTSRVDRFRVEHVGVSGIHSNTLAGFSLYPNPVRDRLQIKVPENLNKWINIEIADLSGKIVVNRQLKSTEYSDVISLDCSNLRAGVYFIKLESDKVFNSFKLVVLD